MRAVKALRLNLGMEFVVAGVSDTEVAEIIDRESGLAEAWEALEQFVGVWDEWLRGDHPGSLSDALGGLRDEEASIALAKITGRGN